MASHPSSLQTTANSARLGLGGVWAITSYSSFVHAGLKQRQTEQRHSLLIAIWAPRSPVRAAIIVAVSRPRFFPRTRQATRHRHTECRHIHTHTHYYNTAAVRYHRRPSHCSHWSQRRERRNRRKKEEKQTDEPTGHTSNRAWIQEPGKSRPPSQLHPAPSASASVCIRRHPSAAHQPAHHLHTTSRP